MKFQPPSTRFHEIGWHRALPLPLWYGKVVSGQTIDAPPPPSRDAMEAPIPPPGTGLLGPPTPSVALPSFACSCSPSVRRSGRRSCCGHGDPDGDVRGLALKFKYDILSLLIRLELACILTGIRQVNKYIPYSTGPHSPAWPALPSKVAHVGPRQPPSQLQGLSTGVQGSPS